MLRETARNWWRWITLRRHRSELHALRVAKRFSFLAILPISVTILFWWFALGLPLALLWTPSFLYSISGPPEARLVATVLQLLISLVALPILVVAAPWFFHWYFIAVGLMFGRPGMADRKEVELIAAIQKAEAASAAT